MFCLASAKVGEGFQGTGTGWFLIKVGDKVNETWKVKMKQQQQQKKSLKIEVTDASSVPTPAPTHGDLTIITGK